MDSLFALKGKDFVLIASETTVMNSIFKLKQNEDKSFDLDSNILLSLSGNIADRNNFGNFIKRNIQFFKFKNTKSLTVSEAAEFARSEYAKALRKSPYQVNSILSGFDKFGGAQMYWMDYLGTLSKVNYAAHGYAAYFVLSVISNFYRPGMDKKEAIEVVKHCIAELRTRFLMSQDNFMIKIVDKTGISVVQ